MEAGACSAGQAFFQVYGTPQDEQARKDVYKNTNRVISIFRGRDFAAGRQIQLLCGEASLPVYIPVLGVWTMRPNNMGEGAGEPLYGPSGFGNPFNNYTWTMAAYDGQLFVGTMDHSYLNFLGYEGWSQAGERTPRPSDFGADLYRFPSSHEPAVPESLNGVGNFTNYGIRTMVSDDALYIGTANPMNRLTDPNDDLPEGGWELLRLRSRRGTFPGEGLLLILSDD
jgi:hypothetical protein